MIVCHCNTITDHDIRRTISWMRAADPGTIVTAGKVYRALGKRPDCGGCMTLFIETMRKSEDFPVPDVASPIPPFLRHPLQTRHQFLE